MNEKTISRRRFFKVAGLALGGATVACCGLGYAASQAAPKPQAGQIETPDFVFGEQDGMKKSVLVAYASRTGSTVGVAAAIGETLAGRGYAVDVKPVSENPDPAAYDLVIVGSAVNGGQWLPEAIEFTRDHQQALRIKPAAVFCVHIMNLGDGETSRKNRAAYLEGVRALVTPVDEAFFAGMGANPQDTSPILRWILRTFNIMPEGDCRDWTKIRAWALTVFA
ncbi:MAG TPA: flavodoxin domain-containing protein [Anaerolinea sp.]|nr:flavodoxin domain-containing protein [Anaerolinea sp.]